ncbi:YidH family protein [Erythrobacter sp. GH1-10]|uniref:YidH family protein n=1 Tax=Erythrobacter sp. GH1-10 TaxID=3349334 RepID=UPI00387813FA
MSDDKSSTDLAEDRTELAQDRTDWAEDRTLMANERTFAGWMRTGLASVGIGLGFNALFGKLEPAWLPKLIATMFIVIGIFVFWAAQRKGCDVHARMQAHKASPLKPTNMRLIAGFMAFGSFALAIGVWLMDFSNS